MIHSHKTAHKLFAEKDNIIKSANSKIDLAYSIFRSITLDFDNGLIVIDGVIDSISYSTKYTRDEMLILMSSRMLDLIKLNGMCLSPTMRMMNVVFFFLSHFVLMIFGHLSLVRSIVR